MIEQIHVKNFESHEDSVFDLSPGVNAIVGDSHVGKSAIRRFFHWINTNRPLGTDFIKKGTKRVFGRVQFDDGVLTRTKTAKTGKYELDSEPDPFSSFGQGVPEKVTELINMSDVNFQTQHGSFFLLQDTPGTVASYLRSVTGLDELTTVTSDIGTRLRSTKSRLTTQTQLVEEMQEEMEQLKRLDLVRLEECIQEYKELEERNGVIRGKVQSLSRVVDRIRELNEAPSISEDIAKALKDRMDELVVEGERVDDERFQLRAVLDRIKEVEVVDVQVRDGLLDEVQETITTYQTNLGRSDDLDGVLKRLVALGKGAKHDEFRLVELREEEQELLSQLKDCPHCGVELTEESRERLVGEER